VATKYDIQTITETHNRLADPDLSESEMQTELEKPQFLPDIGQMIAVGDSLDYLAESDRYGRFQGMTDKGRYQISTGRWKYARLLDAEEIAACY